MTEQTFSVLDQTKTIRYLMIPVLIVLLVAVFFHYRERETYRCMICHSEKDVFQWHLGRWPGGIPISPENHRLRKSHIERDFYSKNHQHSWTFRQGSPYYLFGMSHGGCAVGSANANELASSYNFLPDFRQFLKEELRTNTLSREEIRTLFTFPRYPKKPLSPKRRQQKKRIETILNRYEQQRKNESMNRGNIPAGTTPTRTILSGRDRQFVLLSGLVASFCSLPLSR